MKLLKCTAYLMFAGIVGFCIGRIFPKKWIRPDSGLFRCFHFENNGRLYEKLNIKKWQNKVPDMSRILPGVVPAKNLSGNYKQRLPDMILETCVAELVHIFVSVLGLACLWLWPGMGGVVVTLIFILLLNLPYIVIQRYTRPRLIGLQRKLCSYSPQKEGELCAY